MQVDLINLKGLCMIEWDHWRTMLAVFRSGTYLGAAKSLRIDATTVGRRLKQLEDRLGQRLFLRDGDRFFPTRHCESLLAHVENAAEALADAEYVSAETEDGAVWRSLRMTAAPFLVTNLFAPQVGHLTRRRRIKVELIGTASKAEFQRREADIAIRIEDRRGEISGQDRRIKADRIGTITYAVYSARDSDVENRPWAGLIEEHVRSSGGDVMQSLAGEAGFQYRVYQFDALTEIVASGAARALLPRLIGETDPRLESEGDVVLTQPLWILSHRQDRDDPHLVAARNWITELVERCR